MDGASNTIDNDKTVTVLSIDGGGIRGIIPARMLMYLEEKTGRPTSELFDLIAGSSTGGLLALGFTRPTRRGSGEPKFEASDLYKLYRNDGPEIFQRSGFRTVRTGDALFRVKYDSKPIERVLKRHLGASLLSDALTNVLVTAYDLANRQAYFFKSHRAKENPDRDYPMWQAARATSAAPTYFAPLRVEASGEQPERSLIDGGVFANNPAMCAYAEVRAHYPPGTPVLVVSLGTGIQTEPMPHEKTKNWGKLHWAQPILDVVFHGVSDTVDYQLKQALRDERGAYHRFQTRLEGASDNFDDASDENLAALERLAERLIREREDDLARLSDTLVEIAEGE